jgi:hypothetical protein
MCAHRQRAAAPALISAVRISRGLRPLVNAIPCAPEVITVPAEPGTAPPPAWSAMSTGLDAATRPACSRLPPLARSAVPYAAPGYVMELAEPSSTPTPALFARADVAGNDDGGRPRCYPPGLARHVRRKGHVARQALRVRNASGGRRSLRSLLQCGLRSSVKSNVAGNASAAPNP